MSESQDSLPNPQAWEWLKNRLEEAVSIPEDRLPPGGSIAQRKLAWLMEHVRNECPDIHDFAMRHGAHLLESATQGFSPASDPLFASHAFSGRLFDTGDLVGNRYTVKRFLGAGGMGEVYEVEDRELQGRSLALKTIRGDLTNSKDAGPRFEREVRAALNVAHPNVCRIYDVGRHGVAGVDRLFLTMELLEGRLLSECVRPATALPSGSPSRSFGSKQTAGNADLLPTQTLQPESRRSIDFRVSAMPEQEAHPVIMQLVAGLAAIHSRGIIHRDFKPSNVMLVEEGTGMKAIRVVIMDFGLARALEREGIDYSITQAGLQPGTPAYMAPEQHTMSGPATCATDVYSLGVTLHEMLTGHRYELNGSFRALHKARISRWLKDLVIGCLQADRTQRYQDAGAVAAALARRGRRIRPVQIGIAAGAGVLAIGAVYWFSIASTGVAPTRAQMKYSEGLDALRSAAPFLASSRFEQALELYPDYAVAAARLAQARLEMQATGMARDALTRVSPAAIQRLGKRNSELYEAIRFSVLGNHEKAIPLFERLSETAPTASGDEDRRDADIDLAREYERANQPAKALAIWRKLAAASPYSMLRAAVLETTFEHIPAQKRFDDALAEFEREHNIEGESEVLFDRASSLPHAQYGEAIPMLQSVIQRSILSHDSYQEARAHLAIAFFDFDKDRLAEAQEQAETAMAIAHRANIESVFSAGLRNLGAMMLARGERVKAEQYLTDAVRLAHDNRDNHREIDNLIALADLHNRMGQSKLAETESKKAVEYYSGKSTFKAILASTILIFSQREQGNFAAAEASLATARALYIELKQPDPSLLASIELSNSQLERFRGNYPAAVTHMRASLDASISVNSRLVGAYSALMLAENLAFLGEFDDARSVLKSIPEDGNRTKDIEAHRATINFFSKPKSMRPEFFVALAAATHELDDRMAIVVVMFESMISHGDRQGLEQALSNPEYVASSWVNRETRLYLRLARARALVFLGRKTESLTALGNFQEFETHAMLFWRAALIRSRAATNNADANHWRTLAKTYFEQLRSGLGPVQYSHFSRNRADLAPEFAEIARINP